LFEADRSPILAASIFQDYVSLFRLVVRIDGGRFNLGPDKELVREESARSTPQRNLGGWMNCQKRRNYLRIVFSSVWSA
jgi:hypothetical protein